MRQLSTLGAAALAASLGAPAHAVDVIYSNAAGCTLMADGVELILHRRLALLQRAPSLLHLALPLGQLPGPRAHVAGQLIHLHQGGPALVLPGRGDVGPGQGEQPRQVVAHLAVEAAHRGVGPAAVVLVGPQVVGHQKPHP